MDRFWKVIAWLKRLWDFLYADYYPMGEEFDGPIPSQWLKLAQEVGVDRNASFRDFVLALEAVHKSETFKKMNDVNQRLLLIRVKAALDSIDEITGLN